MSDTENIQWDVPPPEPGRNSKSKRVLAACKERPGEWAFLGRSWISFASQLRKLGLETRTANFGDDKKYDLWARWPADTPELAAVPDPEPEPDTAPRSKPGRCTTKNCARAEFRDGLCIQHFDQRKRHA